MDEREMIQPPESRRGSTLQSWAARRTVLAVVAVLGLVVLAVLFVVVTPPGAAVAPPGAAPAALGASAPGVQPPVQKWFKDREALQIELNNALVLAQKLPRQAGAAAPICARVAKVARAMAVLAKVPAAGLDAPVRAGIDKFELGAAACLKGDLPQAEQLMAAGLADRAAAQDQIDAILDGD